MSASLVGSEMCIRDRPTTSRMCQRHRKPLPQRPPQPRLLQSRAGCPRAVSYTHLTLPTICSV
eukprot:6146284-Alexandrium_andersonii.AAC.1